MEDCVLHFHSQGHKVTKILPYLCFLELCILAKVGMFFCTFALMQFVFLL